MPKVVCPNGHRLQVQDGHIGQTIRCPSCQASFVAVAEPEAGGGFYDPNAAGGFAAPGGGSVSRGSSSMGSMISNFIGKPLLFIGLIVVIFGKGCDGVGYRYLARVQANRDQEVRKFNSKWDKKELKIARKEMKYTDIQNDPESDKDQKKNASEQLKDLREDRDKVRRDRKKAYYKFVDDKYDDMQEQNIQAFDNHRMVFYYYKWIDLVGTIILMFGLIAIGFAGQGGDRWVAYVMIGVVTFSIYVVGIGWSDQTAREVVQDSRRDRAPQPRLSINQKGRFEKEAIPRFP